MGPQKAGDSTPLWFGRVTHLKEGDPFARRDTNSLHGHRLHPSLLDVERVERGSDIGFERANFVAVDSDLCAKRVHARSTRAAVQMVVHGASG